MPTDSPHIAVVCGGTSPEAAVSRKSAAEVEKALRTSFQDVHVLELDSSLPAELARSRFDVVFPVLHGGAGEDGTVQGFLEIFGIPYVGSGVSACAYAMNKHVAKQLFRATGLPVARDLLVFRDEGRVLAAADEIVRAFPEGAVIKPVDQGSAIGVSFPGCASEAVEGLQAVFEVSKTALVEERVAGREITVGVLDLDSPIALPVIEIRTIDGWYDFDHRYTPGASQHILPAPLEPSVYNVVQSTAVSAHVALGCRDFSRADFVVTDAGRVCLLEVNTLPSMTSTSLFPEAAAAAGISFVDLVRRLVLNCLTRRGSRT